MRWRLRTTAERSTLSRPGHVHNQLDFFSKGGWTSPTDLRAQLKYDPFIAHLQDVRVQKSSTNETRTDTRVLCLEVLDTANTSSFGANRDDVLPEDLWPNFRAMVTLYWVHVKPRSTMFDPSQCAMSPIPAGVQILSRETFLRDTRARRLAEIEHDFNKDKGCLVCLNRRSLMDSCVYVSPGGCGTQGGTQRQRPRDRDRLLQTGCAATLAMGCDQVAPTKTGKLVSDEPNTQQNWLWDETKSRQEAWWWDTANTESKKCSVKHGVARGRRDSGTDSEGDDPRTGKHSPRQLRAEAMVQTHYVARRMDHLSEFVATGSVRPRQVGLGLFPNTREP